MRKINVVGIYCMALLIVEWAFAHQLMAAASFTAKRTIDNVYYRAGSKIAGIIIEVTPATGGSTNAVVVDTIPEGFAVSNPQTTNGTAAVSGNTLTWTLANATAKVELTYDLTAPAANPPLYALLTGIATEGTSKVTLVAATLKHTPGLGSQWMIGANSGIWAIMDGVLRAYSDTGFDPKHAWVNLEMADGDYTVVCDCRMMNWKKSDLARAGVSIRINPNDSGGNAGRGISLLFHNDQNSIDFLNDQVKWGTLTDTPWETNKWYTFSLMGVGSNVDGYFAEKGTAEELSGKAYLDSWDDPSTTYRMPGFPGLTASTAANLEAQFDNFKVIDSSGITVFEDNFDEAVSVRDWSLY